MISVADPEFPRGRGAKPKGGDYQLLGKIFLKLQENEENRARAAHPIFFCKSTTEYEKFTILINNIKTSEICDVLDDCLSGTRFRLMLTSIISKQINFR